MTPDEFAAYKRIPLTVLLDDKNLDAMLSVMRVRSGGDLRNVERWDLRAAIVEVLGWEGIHALSKWRD